MKKTAKLLAVALACALASGASQAASNWQPWEAFKSASLEAGRIVDRSSERQVTTSEGQSYALFFALVGNDRETFDSVLDWTRRNLSAGDLGQNLPAWLWGRDPQSKTPEWKVLETNNATDADMWIAYCLLEAGRLWNHPEYTQQGQRLLKRLRSLVRTVDTIGDVILPGIRGFEVDGGVLLNPSYYPIFMLSRFALEDASWKSVREGSIRALTRTSPDGYAPEWAHVLANGTVSEREDRTGGYNAIRTYLWASMISPDDPAHDLLLTHFEPMKQLAQRLVIPYDTVNTASGAVRGWRQDYFGRCLMPMLGNDRISALLRAIGTVSDRSGSRYYGGVLSLFAGGYDIGLYRFDVQGRLVIDPSVLEREVR